MRQLSISVAVDFEDKSSRINLFWYQDLKLFLGSAVNANSIIHQVWDIDAMRNMN